MRKCSLMLLPISEEQFVFTFTLHLTNILPLSSTVTTLCCLQIQAYILLKEAESLITLHLLGCGLFNYKSTPLVVCA